MNPNLLFPILMLVLPMEKNLLYPELEKYVEGVKMEFDQISPDRKESLMELSEYISLKVNNQEKVKLIFICTHNSRRSHMAQLWAQASAWHYQVPDVETYSGGTEATAFNPRAVKAITDAGFVLESKSGENNPKYRVKYAEEGEAIIAYSKVYDTRDNPASGFAAVMTCSQADANCPLVRGAEDRISIPYEDPKEFDGTEQEEEKYRERCRQIGREMLYVFSKVRK